MPYDEKTQIQVNIMRHIDTLTVLTVNNESIRDLIMIEGEIKKLMIKLSKRR